MINIKTIEIRNFMSYGDYVTKLDVSSIGTALIVGQDEDKNRANGAGKTSLVEAMIWCLFGRTIYKQRPADNIVNWYVKQDCYVSIETIDGYKITRTRKMANHDDLLVHTPQGDDISSGTNPNTQELLQKLFNLDYNIFTSSIFFGQFGQPFLELSDTKRRATLERILHIDHLGTYAKVADEKHQKAEKEQERHKASSEQLEKEISRINAQIESNRDRELSYEEKREQKVRKLKTEIIEEEERCDGKIKSKELKITGIRKEAEELPSKEYLSSLRSKWDTINKIEGMLSKKRNDVDHKTIELRSHKQKEDELLKEVEDIEKTSGTICSECEQPISELHSEQRSTPKRDKLSELDSKITEVAGSIAKSQKSIKGFSKKLENSRPEDDLNETIRQYNKRETFKESIGRLQNEIKEVGSDLTRTISNIKSRIKETKEESNPYGSIINELHEEHKNAEIELKEHQKKVSRFNILLKHLKYIKDAYHDKKKIRAFVLSNLVPFFNRQLEYYLQAFNVDFDLEFNAYLQPKMDKWPYEMCSGGERKRIDLSSMFALYDLHNTIHGNPCNILVFDEVDGRLDEDGIEAFANILTNDFTFRDDGPKTILVISHRDEMRDAFPSKIMVRKKGGFSYLEEIKT